MSRSRNHAAAGTASAVLRSDWLLQPLHGCARAEAAAYRRDRGGSPCRHAIGRRRDGGVPGGRAGRYGTRPCRPRGIRHRSVVSLGAWLVWAVSILALGTGPLPERQTRSDIPELLSVLGFASAPGVFIALAAMPPAAPARSSWSRLDDRRRGGRRAPGAGLSKLATRGRGVRHRLGAVVRRDVRRAL